MNAGKLRLVPPTDVAEPEEGVDLARLIAKGRRHWRLFVTVAAVIMAIVVAISMTQTSRYTGNAKVVLDTRKHAVANIEEVLSGLPADGSGIDTEVEILKSRTMADRVVKVLGLDNDPEFNVFLRPRRHPLDALRRRLAMIGLGKAPPAAIEQPLANVNPTKEHEAVVDRVLRRLKVGRSGSTFVIDIFFQSADPRKAALIANTFADRYLTEQMQDKYEATQQATQWLNDRLAELRPQVDQAETAVEQYKAQHGLLASVGASLTEEEISNLNKQLAQAQADQAEREARLRTAGQQLAAGSTGEDTSGVLASETVRSLRSQKATTSAKLAELQARYGPRFPEVQSVQHQLTDIDAQIQQEVARQMSNLQAEAKVAQGRTSSLEASLGRAKGTLIGNNAASVELADLQRKANATSTLYDSLLNRAKQLTTDQGDQQSDARVLVSATIPTVPSYPNKQLNLAGGLLLALAGGIGVIFLVEALDSSLATSEDISRALGVPCLGAIPTLKSTLLPRKNVRVTPGRYVVDKPLSAFAEAFRNLRASVQFSRAHTGTKVIMITSALPAEGKTTTSFCLGRSAAMSGAKVVVVDCDLRRRQLNEMLNLEPEVGLVEVLQGSCQLDDALIQDELTGAYFLPLARSPQTPKDLFSTPAMDRLLATLRERFDLVLLDTAPVIPIADTRMLVSKTDFVLFLARWRKTPRKAIEAAFTVLNAAGGDIAGVALTLVDAQQQAKYGYGDSSYYYHAYRKYYSQ